MKVVVEISNAFDLDEVTDAVRFFFPNNPDIVTYQSDDVSTSTVCHRGYNTCYAVETILAEWRDEGEDD